MDHLCQDKLLEDGSGCKSGQKTEPELVSL